MAELVDLLEPERVSEAELERRYPSERRLTRAMLGFVPRTDGLFEIWQPAAQANSLIVPNFMNMPLLLWGLTGAPKSTLGLMMYGASRGADCAYCTAHCCAFAIRRGADEDIAVKLSGGGSVDDATRAAVEVAFAMGRVPHAVTPEIRASLRSHFKAADVQWLVLAAASMGMLNKLSDAAKVELERPVIDEVGDSLQQTGWSGADHKVVETPSVDAGVDTLRRKLGVFPALPGAVKNESALTKGVPSKPRAIGSFLDDAVGYSFPVLSRLTHGRAIRALGAALRVNVSAESSALGLATKSMVGHVLAVLAGSRELMSASRALGKRQGIEGQRFDDIESYVFHQTDLADEASIADALALLDALSLSERDKAAMVLAKACAPSPTQTSDLVLSHARALEPSAIVELIGWLGLFQVLYRIEAFYGDE